jgi:vancomycin resistance protein YoaR
LSARVPASRARSGRRRRTARPVPRLQIALGVGAVAAVGLALGLGYAGSSDRLAEGITIAGVDVGGMRVDEARALLQRRAARAERTPVEFVAGSQRWRITPRQLGVRSDWAEAVESARRQGEGFAPVRGFRRLRTRFFGADVTPPTEVFEAALTYQVSRMATAIRQAPREAEIALRGLTPEIVRGRVGRRLDVEAAEVVVARSLASFGRAPVGLPVRVDPPQVTAAELRPVARRARTILSAPVRLTYGATRYRIPRWRLAELLLLPSGGTATLALGGPKAEEWFGRLDRTIGRPARDAGFTVAGDGSVSVVPGQTGLRLERSKTAARLLAAASRPRNRVAAIVVASTAPAITTAEARGMGITSFLSSYGTDYAGTADRINNLQLAVSLLDGALIAPGATFSFNDRVGERTEERGFRSAPIIVGGEYEEGIGGGVSQVATTVFNAAWEAGLPIPQRAAHALYISRYPLGRDATVNYPDLDLRFVNDTEHWLLLKAGAGSTGISVALYGAPTGRRVESNAGELRVRGAVPEQTIRDATLPKGSRLVEEEGAPPTIVSVERIVYEADGEVRRRETWTTSYLGEKRVVRLGTKPKEEEKPKPAPTTTSATTTTATTTTPTPTTTSPKATTTAPATTTTPRP